jgi:hypothetical protein
MCENCGSEHEQEQPQLQVSRAWAYGQLSKAVNAIDTAIPVLLEVKEVVEFGQIRDNIGTDVDRILALLANAQSGVVALRAKLSSPPPQGDYHRQDFDP